jgi:Ca2+-binding RTX toxin-like protein
MKRYFSDDDRWDDDHGGDWDHGGEDHHDDHHDRGGHDDDHGGFDFDFELPDIFKIDFSDFNLKSFGKITDYEIGHKHLSVTLGDEWTFSVDGSGFDFTLKHGSKIPVVTGGTVDSFTIDGPGKADFSISGLDMSAKAFYKAVVSLDGAALLDLVLGGDETISGTGYGDYLNGLKGNDTLLGNDGNDWLIGGIGDDTISGGKGSDYMEGGKGADSFLFAAKSGMDMIGDFDASNDVLDLSALGIDKSICEFLHENIVSEGGRHGGGRCGEDGDVIVILGNGSAVKLDGVDRWELSADNFVL